MLFSNKKKRKEQITATSTWINLANDDKHKNQDTKEYIHYYAFYIKFKEKNNQNISLGMHIQIIKP